MIIGQDPKFLMQNNQGVLTLNIRKPGTFDSGKYSCMAVNDLGQDEVECKLDIRSKNRGDERGCRVGGRWEGRDEGGGGALVIWVQDELLLLFEIQQIRWLILIIWCTLKAKSWLCFYADSCNIKFECGYKTKDLPFNLGLFQQNLTLIICPVIPQLPQTQRRSEKPNSKECEMIWTKQWMSVFRVHCHRVNKIKCSDACYK